MSHNLEKEKEKKRKRKEEEKENGKERKQKKEKKEREEEIEPNESAIMMMSKKGLKLRSPEAKPNAIMLQRGRTLATHKVLKLISEHYPTSTLSFGQLKILATYSCMSLL